MALTGEMTTVSQNGSSRKVRRSTINMRLLENCSIMQILFIFWSSTG